MDFEGYIRITTCLKNLNKTSPHARDFSRGRLHMGLLKSYGMWEGWLKFGTFRNMWNQECYKYENRRPTRRTMNRLLKMLDDYNNKRFGNGDN